MAALDLVPRSLVKQKRALAAGATKNSILRFASTQNGKLSDPVKILSSIALITMGLLLLAGLSIILSFVVRETGRATIPAQRVKRQPGKNHFAHKELISDLHAESTASAQLRSKKIPIEPF